MKALHAGLLVAALAILTSCGGSDDNPDSGKPGPKPTIPGPVETPTPIPVPTNTPQGGNSVSLESEIGSGLNYTSLSTENYQIELVIGEIAPVDSLTSAQTSYELESVEIEVAK